jgi:hypothetical protein
MLLIGENKTTTADIAPGSDYWRGLKLDRQISVYIDAGRQLGLDIGGVFYNVLRVPQHRPLMMTPVEERKYTKPTAKDPCARLYKSQRDRDETPEEYEQRILLAIAEDPAKYYQRQTVVRLASELEESRLDIWQTAANIRDARRLSVWPRNPDSCLHWGRACDYLSACTGEQDIDDDLLFYVGSKRHEELDDEGDDVLTQSSIRCYSACARKFYYRYERRIRRRVPDAEPLRRGKSIHRALEVWWKTGDLDASLAKLDQDKPYERARERAMMIGYNVMWSDAPRRVRSVEKKWTVPLINPDTGFPSKTFRLVGRTDAVMEAE